MAANVLLIDTDVLIDYSRGIQKTKDYLEKLEHSHRLSISVITKLELMVGCENKLAFNALKKFLTNFEIIQISKSSSEMAVSLFETYRLSHGVMIPDMLIASTALTFEIPLLTKNRKDFGFIKNIDLMEYTI